MSDAEFNDLSSKKLSRMKVKILIAERDNLKEKSNDAMVEIIRKIIIDEAKKSY